MVNRTDGPILIDRMPRGSLKFVTATDQYSPKDEVASCAPRDVEYACRSAQASAA